MSSALICLVLPSETHKVPRTQGGPRVLNFYTHCSLWCIGSKVLGCEACGGVMLPSKAARCEF
eukprot:4524310-Pyramimonas_sp.AAC.1